MPPPKDMIQNSRDIVQSDCAVAAAAAIPNPHVADMGPANKVSLNGQVNLKRQLDFIKSLSNPDVKD
jgi:hypothetical protein